MPGASVQRRLRRGLLRPCGRRAHCQQTCTCLMSFRATHTCAGTCEAAQDLQSTLRGEKAKRRTAELHLNLHRQAAVRIAHYSKAVHRDCKAAARSGRRTLCQSPSATGSRPCAHRSACIRLRWRMCVCACACELCCRPAATPPDAVRLQSKLLAIAEAAVQGPLRLRAHTRAAASGPSPWPPPW